ncbi:Serine carboxypeptidase-like 6 [Platanthera guangdongensis]|uniref:Serine carboxypeptidase-like 6 n=1 Tax=Platanthera guangdongensis TaxID=2320717 RepID=A0ABR2M5R0_9ASPA
MAAPLSHFPQLLFFLALFSDLWPCFLSAVNITHLPGFAGALPFRLETGYVNMDADSGAELFYYFVESERNPSEDPLLLWLTGGPGCSGFNALALAMGLLQIASMIFLDWPFGTGFSHSRTDKDYFTDDWHAKQLIYVFLKKWLLDHPFFLSNPFYMGVNHMVGKWLHLFLMRLFKVSKLPIFISYEDGYLIGNAITGEKGDKNTQASHAYGLGLISEEVYKVLTGDLLSNYWLNNRLVRQALHIKEGSVGRWHRCDFNVNAHHYKRNIPSSLPHHRNLTSRGYRALVYNGDHDLKVPFVGTLKWIKSLGYSILDPWRAWYVDNQVAGFTTLFSNDITFVTVKGRESHNAGNRPAQCFGMFKRWISHEVL